MLMNSLLGIVILFLSPLIVLSNSLIISVWLRFKRLRTPSNTLILSLAVADLGFGLVLPAAVALELTLSQDATEDYECRMALCIIPFAILLTFCAASLLSITLIALDRFTSVSQPLRYNHFVTMSNVHRFVTGCWVYAVIIGIVVPVVFLSRNQWPVWGGEFVLGWLAIFLYGPCLLSILVSYGYIYVIARNHHRAIYSVEVSLHNGHECEVTDTSHLSHSNRYGLTLALILSSILISWLPLLVLAIYDLVAYRNTELELATNGEEEDDLRPEAHIDGDVEIAVPPTHKQVMILLNPQWRMLASLPLVLTSLLNPWLYGYRSSEMRLAVIRLLDWMVTKITGRSNPDSIDILYSYHKGGDFTSCGGGASNIRIPGVSPTQTTVQCCTPSPRNDRKHSSLSFHLMIYDNHQVSSL